MVGERLEKYIFNMVRSTRIICMRMCEYIKYVACTYVCGGYENENAACATTLLNEIATAMVTCR